MLEQVVVRHLSKLAQDDRLLNRVLSRAEETLKSERPKAGRELSEARGRLAKAEARRANLVEILSQDGTSVPQSLWGDVRAIDEESRVLRAEVERLASEMSSWENQAPDVDCFRAGLRGLAASFSRVPADQKYKLLRSVIDSLHVDECGKASLFLLHEAEGWHRAMKRGAEKKRAHGKVRGPAEWLPGGDRRQNLGDEVLGGT